VAELHQSHFTEIKNRKSVQDLDDLIALLDLDGEITLVDDPSDAEIKAAREQQAKDAEAAAAEAEAKAEEEKAAAEEEKRKQAEAVLRDKTAAMPLQEEVAPPEPETPPDETEGGPEVNPQKSGSRSKK